MKKPILLFGMLFAFCATLFAKHIDENTAKQIGKTFLITKTNTQNVSISSNLDLAYKSVSKSKSANAKIDVTTFFYVFNAGQNGFVIISADDNVSPILGYSDEGAFDENNIPQSVQKWLEDYKNQIRYVIEHNVSATPEIQAEWTAYLNGSTQGSVNKTASTTAVNPLLQTKWDQSPYYNALCPFDVQYNQRTVTGCVATGMAQIMKYWNYPATGAGFHSYNHQTYGTLSANFGTTTYQWSSMPTMVSSANSAVATLMYHCGVSVDMQYGVASTGGSGAYVVSALSPITNCAEYALKTYFSYKPTLQGVVRSNYTQTQWLNLIKAELNANRPVLYAGSGSAGGHCFVADGYDNNDYVHFNWGWSGNSDGYFQINALNPAALGTGGGSGGFNSQQHAVVGIEPPANSGGGGGPGTYSLDLYNYVTPSSSTIYYGQSFNVTTNIANSGTSTFNGDYCAAVFDSQFNFIDYVQTLTNYSLQGGYAYTNNLSFSTSGLFTMLPGTYYVGIFYRPTGGNWIQVANSGNYTNMVQMTVINPNNIELNSSMSVSPSNTLTQGQAASINLNIINEGAATFYGQYQVNLYELDGSFVQTINTINENNGLPYNYTYQSPYLTFNTAAITATPGTYLLAVLHKPNGGSWELTGSSYHQNPIKVIVKAPSLSPDQYENDDTFAQSYNLPISFSGNSTTKNTVGSNIHVGTDNDYYKINLPEAYNYTITARLHDSYDSGNGNVYSVDALFSYSTDEGATWSDTYDDVMNGSIIVHNGGTVYFHVAPYFSGNVGTYLLDMAINREDAVIGIKEMNVSDLIKVYPNPAKDVVTIDFSQNTEKANVINVLNIQGQIINSVSLSDNSKTLQLPTQSYANGVYIIQIQSSQGVLTKKIIISK